MSFTQSFTDFSASVAAIVFATINVNGAEIPLVVIWLFGGAIVFTVGLGFINIRGFWHGVQVLRGKFRKEDSAGEISPFQALTTALSGTVGTGNIAGVAIAITLGGPGATFWMIIAGLFSMATKFMEVSLAVKYRQINPDGSIAGGPMYYMRDAFKARGWPKFGAILAVIFSVLCVFGSIAFGNVNQGFVQFSSVTGFDNSIIYGVIYGSLVAVVIIGGIKRIADVTSKLVPSMLALYFGASLYILSMNAEAIPGAFVLIVESALQPDAAYGGFIGVMIMGIRRATYSNEAGTGSSPIAHAAAKVDEPIQQGFVAMLEPFIDTVIICTITALVIIVTGAYQIDNVDGIAITSYAFTTSFSWFPWVLTLIILLFGFSTVISVSYYGNKAWGYLFGERYEVLLTHKILYCITVAMAASVDILAIVDITDSLFFLMAVPNILALYLLLPEVRRDLRDYRTKLVNSE